MRSLLLTLVFALSVSARCVGKKQATGHKQSLTIAKDGSQGTSGDSINGIMDNGGDLNNGTSAGSNSFANSGSSSSSSRTSAAAGPTGNQGQSSKQSNGATSSSSAPSSASSTPPNTGSSNSGSSNTGSSNTGSSNTGSSNTSGNTGSNNNGSSNGTTAGSGGSTNTLSTSTSGGASSGNCGGLKGVCFNGGFQPSMYDKITTASDWITFQMGIPGSASSRTTQDHIPMMPFASNVAEAVKAVNGPNPPAWLLTFNEPDFSYPGVTPGTPTMTPEEAAVAIKDLLDHPGTSTKYVAPATADSSGKWQEDFFAACKCKDFFSAYNIHQYNKDSGAVIDAVTAYHAKFSDKPLWITEIAPGNAGCSVSWDQAGQFMKDIFKFAKNSGFVDKVFWNSGNQLTNGDTNVCNSWLIDSSGNPGPLLAAYEAMDCT
ncbi:MAG: hypothetical protein L6R37_000147 [Teloschistes peruensis]|nr:MAG: hypothetical protein L6R37_000147 [Teloschistes peruensis]